MCDAAGWLKGCFKWIELVKRDITTLYAGHDGERARDHATDPILFERTHFSFKCRVK